MDNAVGVFKCVQAGDSLDITDNVNVSVNSIMTEYLTPRSAIDNRTVPGFGLRASYATYLRHTISICKGRSKPHQSIFYIALQNNE